jgi:uncharacterized membrane protein YfhO
MCNHKLKHISEVQNLISIINPVTYLKNQNKIKEETQKYKKNKNKVFKSYKYPKKGYKGFKKKT